MRPIENLISVSTVIIWYVCVYEKGLSFSSNKKKISGNPANSLNIRRVMTLKFYFKETLLLNVSANVGVLLEN